jgi:hypothetical protein
MRVNRILLKPRTNLLLSLRLRKLLLLARILTWHTTAFGGSAFDRVIRSLCNTSVFQPPTIACCYANWSLVRCQPHSWGLSQHISRWAFSCSSQVLYQHAGLLAFNHTIGVLCRHISQPIFGPWACSQDMSVSWPAAVLTGAEDRPTYVSTQFACSPVNGMQWRHLSQPSAVIMECYHATSIGRHPAWGSVQLPRTGELLPKV